MTRLRSLLNLPGKFYKLFETLIDKFPRSYLASVTLLALAGYAVILLFPLLLLSGILSIYQGLTAGNDIAWDRISVWLVISLVAGLASYRITQYKPWYPLGLTLAEDKAPELFGLVVKLRSYFKRPQIHKIIITPNYELDIVKTPRLALPVCSLNTMIIGLPLMQCLDAKQFEYMVARSFAQFARREHPLTNWLYRLRVIWQQQRCSFARQKGLGIQPLKWFFSLYAPLYTALSVQIARHYQLNADSSAMEFYNDEEVRRMITTDAACRYYLHKRYWPAVHKVATMETKALPAPHKKMAAAVRVNFKQEKLPRLLDETSRSKPERQDPVPALPDRIRNIGHNNPDMEELQGPTAAAHYLGTSLNGIIAILDKLWLKTFLEDRKQKHAQSRKHRVTTQAAGH